MAQSPIASIDGGKGQVFLLGSSTVRWRLAKGISPVVETFDIQNKDVPFLTNTPIDGVTLTIQDSHGGGGTWSKLSVLGFSPGPHKNISRVTVADRRWTWPYVHVLKRFNFRRNSGFRRRRNWRNIFPIDGDVVTVIQFAKWSLNFDEEWTPIESLLDVLLSPEALNIPFNQFDFDNSIPNVLESTRIDNLLIDDPGNIALDKVLKTIPGADLYIDPEGNVIFFSTVSSAEGAQFEALGPEMVGGGHVEFITNEEVRPSAIRVLFTIEAEVRFDHKEKQDIPRDTIVENQGKLIDEKSMENVLPVPDPEIQLQGRNGTDAQGTWVEFNEYLNAAVIKNGRGLLKNLDVPSWHNVIQTAFIPEMDVWAALGLAGNADAAGDEVDWAARLSTWQAHYRRTYRLNSKWMDRTLSVRPWLIGTIDQASGQRAPAAVFANYAVRNTLKGILGQVRNADEIAYAMNFNSFPTDPDNLATGFQAPALIQIIDSDQGIVGINYQLDPFNLSDIVFPSFIQNNPRMPNKATRNPGQLTTFEQSDPIGDKRVKLSADHKLAIVLTLVPASPNDKRQLYAITVTPQDLISENPNRLTPSMLSGLKNARGPVKEIRVGGGLIRALIAWPNDPDRNIEIDRLFGVEDGVPNLDGLVVNDVAQDELFLGQAASLKEFAFSVAAAEYALEHDRLIGTATGILNHSLRPAGNLEDVAYEVQQNGVTTSALAFPQKLQPLEVEAFMKSSTRAIIFREVQSSK